MDDISVHFGILTDQVPQRLGCVPSVLVCNRATKVSLSQTGQRLSLQVSLGQTGHGLGKRSPPVRGLGDGRGCAGDCLSQTGQGFLGILPRLRPVMDVQKASCTFTG